ncbi:MAG: cellbiose transporter subunit [Firmicutes bacterium]|nr:cellbiose transporter subunit [Bacillota bacterium]
MNFNKEKIAGIAGMIQSNKYLQALSGGLMLSLPLLIIGAISTLLSALPFEGYQTFIKTAGLKPYLALAANFTIDMIAFYVSFLVAYRLADSYEHDALMAGVSSSIAFLILTPIGVFDKVAAIPFQWLGASGLFVAMLVAILSTYLYMLIVNKNWVIKMPAGVPPTVIKTFSSIIPSIVILALFTSINAIFGATEFKNIHNFIYKFLQIPLQHIGGSFWGLCTFIIISQILWMFGVHGSMVTNVVAKPLLLSMDIANLAAFKAGEPLPFIISWSFRFLYSLLGGGGCTIGLCLLMAFKAKSEQLRTIGKISLPTSFCSINEPLVFGIPIVLNATLAVPYLLTPLLTTTIAYVLTVMGIVPTPIGIFVPTGTPMFFSAFIEGGVMLVILQVILVAFTVICYYPFFRKLDVQKCAEEAAYKNAEA